MKVLQSSSRGGRGVGRGRGSGGDSRFGSRFTDPRFQTFRGRGGVGRGVGRRDGKSGYHRGGSGRGIHQQATRGEAESAALADPRFAKLLKRKTEEEEEEEDSDEVEEHSDAASGQGSNDLDDEDRQQLLMGEAELEDLDDDAIQELDHDVNAWSASDTEFVEARRRLAVVNCDWDHIRAVDLYAILFHALPLGGQLHDVRVYMSDFGRKMIEHERVRGPNLWTKPGDTTATDEDDGIGEGKGPQEKGNGEVLRVEEIGDEADDGNDGESHGEDGDDGHGTDDGWVNDNPAMFDEVGEDGEVFSSGKYRKYERQRMKYYYAIATFDSAATAAEVYAQLDGMDIEASGVVLDLRYVDDDEVFTDHVSKADRVSPNFRPLSSFKMAAMSQSQFRISWDQDDVFRHQSIRDSFTGTTEEDDIAAYLAPPDSDGEDDIDDDAPGGRGAVEAAKRKKQEERRRSLRRKYAALLDEIGGLEEEQMVGKAKERNDSRDEGVSDGEVSSGSDGSDDSLNRFSDVELSETDNGSDEDDMEDDGIIEGNMEGTIDMDADGKAHRLQRGALVQKQLKEGTLAQKSEIKHRLHRKEMKKAKKQLIMEEKEAERVALEKQKTTSRQQLQELLGSTDEGAVRLRGKEKRKIHAQAKRKQAAEERALRKRSRVISESGAAAHVKKAEDKLAAQAAVESIDPRFQKKLLSDPRFHLEIAGSDKRVHTEVASLAAQVARARRVTMDSAGGGRKAKTAGQGGQKNNAPIGGNTTDTEDAVDFFLSRPSKRARKA